LAYEQVTKEYAAQKIGKRVLQWSVRQLINKYVLYFSVFCISVFYYVCGVSFFL